jgi:hypothetical protein
MTFETIKTLADIIERKAESLANTGCDIDFKTIETNLGVEGTDDELTALWFDGIAAAIIEPGRHNALPPYGRA